MTVTIDDIRAAQARISGAVERTPCVHSRVLSEIAGAEIWIKFENLQFTASFKERGVVNRLSALTEEEKARGVIANSAGNHAMALAYHAQRIGAPATIVMPETAPIVKVETTRRFGAKVVLHGETFAEAAERAEQIQKEQNLVYVHPYNDDMIIAGQGTIALEMLETAPDLQDLIIPIGGGGLISGNAIAAKSVNRDIRIFGAEAELYPSMHALLNGYEASCGGNTLAEGIAVKNPAERCLAYVRELVEEVFLVSEPRLEEAVARLCMIEKTVVEGAGAAGLGALLDNRARFEGRKVGLILCGGNIDSRILASVLQRELVRSERLIGIRIAGKDTPGSLATICRIIGDCGGNIVEVSHNRLALNVPAKGTEFDFLIESRDARHSEEIRSALREAGYSVAPFVI